MPELCENSTQFGPLESGALALSPHWSLSPEEKLHGFCKPSHGGSEEIWARDGAGVHPQKVRCFSSAEILVQINRFLRSGYDMPGKGGDKTVGF